mmetsp:Transcript_19721/g.42647  ORF Transcript_19721/g.42647 Transcript_19721/m.42647 type:complete len:208 (-) Transcript_19721:153-776(-)
MITAALLNGVTSLAKSCAGKKTLFDGLRFRIAPVRASLSRRTKKNSPRTFSRNKNHVVRRPFRRKGQVRVAAVVCLRTRFPLLNASSKSSNKESQFWKKKFKLLLVTATATATAMVGTATATVTAKGAAHLGLTMPPAVTPNREAARPAMQITVTGIDVGQHAWATVTVTVTATATAVRRVQKPRHWRLSSTKGSSMRRRCKRRSIS